MKVNVAIVAALAVLGTVGGSWTAVMGQQPDGSAADPYLTEAGLEPCPGDNYFARRDADQDFVLLCDVLAYSNQGIRDRAMADRLLEVLFMAEQKRWPIRTLLALKTADVLIDLGEPEVALRLIDRHVQPDADPALVARAGILGEAVQLLSDPSPELLDAFEQRLMVLEAELGEQGDELARETLLVGWRIAGFARLGLDDNQGAQRAFLRLSELATGPSDYAGSYLVIAHRELARIAFEQGDLDTALQLVTHAEPYLEEGAKPQAYLHPGTEGLALLRAQIELAQGKSTAELFPGTLVGDPEAEWRPMADWNLQFDGETQARREEVLTLYRRIFKERGNSDFSERPAIPDLPILRSMAFEQAQSLQVSSADSAASFANALRQLDSDEERARLEAFDRSKARLRQALRRYAALNSDADTADVSDALGELDRARAEIAAQPDFASDYEDTPGEPAIYRSIHPWYLGAFRQGYARGQIEEMLLITPADGDIHVFALGWSGDAPFAWHVLEDGVEKIAPLVDRLRCQVDLKSCTDEAEFALAEMPVSPSEEKGQQAYDQAAAYEIYRLLIKPVEPALTKGSDVFVMASGAMATLPLAMLVTEAPDEDYDWADYRMMRRAPWLGNRYAFTTTPSFDSFRPNRFFPINNVSRDMLFAVADPAFDGQLRPGELRSADFLTLTREGRLANLEAIRKLSPLPGTKAEYEAVRSALQTSEHVALLGTRATEAALRQHPDLGDARYLLLATHGLLPGQNDRGLAEPALVLTPPDDATSENDGLLTASEVRSLNLRAEWVFLSACNTANAGGTGDSLSALASAFLRAGALQVMASHWPVLDDVTPALTTATLRASARNRRGGPGRALQSATRAVREGRWPGGGRIEGWQESWAHPMAWAPFVLISNGDEAIVNNRFDTDWN